jgi:hypothetical protein
VGAALRGLSVGRRCALLGVSRSGYYAAQHRSASARGLVNQQLVVEMRRIHREVDRNKTAPAVAGAIAPPGLEPGLS